MDRRDFLKRSIGAVVASSALLSACTERKKQESESEDGLDGGGEMTLRTNPNTDDRVSLLGYGMMRLPVEGGGTVHENPDAPIDQEQVNRLVDYAIEHGVNYFDTAPVYCKGFSEHATGIALSRHPRKSYYIATKMSNHNMVGQGLSHGELYRRSVEMYRNSMKELQVDCIDYYLLHSIGGGVAYGSTTDDGMPVLRERFLDSGVLDFLMAERRAGRIRNLGFSFHGDVKVFDYMLQQHDAGRYHWDFVQIELNYLDWNYAHQINERNTNASYLYNEVNRRGIPATIMEPLLGGRLARQPDFIVRRMKQREPQTPIARWAFRYAGTPDGVLTVLSGMTYMEHLQQNIATFSPLRPINDDEDKFLMEIADELFRLNAVPCTACQYCMPCPYGLNIPAIFTHFNKCLTESDLVSGSLPDTEYRRQRRAFLIGYDRSVPRLRQADHCIGCGQCAPHCPQRIDIPRQMQRIDQFVEQLKQSVPA